MNLNDLKVHLSIINSEDQPVGIRIHVAIKNEDGNESIAVADVSDDLASDLKEMFRRTINQRFFNDEEFVLTNISDANELINSAFYYDIDEFPEKLMILQEFDTWHDYPEFSFSNDAIESIKAILITIGNQNNYFTVFKHVYPVTILRQDKVLGFVPIGNRFEKLTSSILQINNSIDFIFTENKLIINNLRTLTTSYGYQEVIKNQAKEKVELIRSLDLIVNIDVLTAFIENIKYAKRVLKINIESPVLQLAKDSIVNFIKNHEKLSLKIRFEENGERILLDTDVSKILTIGILNDDFLRSHLTDLDYESERKAEFLIEAN